VPQKEQADQGQRLTLDRVRESFTRSPQKSTRRASRELQQDVAPPPFHLEVRRPTIPLYLSVGLDVRLTKTPHLYPGLPGHPPSLHVTFSSGAMLSIKFTCPLYQELRQRIVAAVDTIDINMLQRVWQELDYRIDVCRVTRGGHIEHL
jgi:hypothetical protein